MKILNKLSFKDKRDQAFCIHQVEKFVNDFIDINEIETIEVYKSEIYLYKYNESGFSHFSINAKVGTSKEMLAYIVGMNTAKQLLKIKG